MTNVAETYRVTSDYDKKDDNELTLKNGDIVEVLKKGKYIWYGQINNSKGFFPSRIVSEIEHKTSSDDAGTTLSSTALIDNEKITIEHTETTILSMNSDKSEESFEKINSAPPLEDKRRTRAKSTGRPPSQVFIKEIILNRSESLDDISTASEDDDPEKQQPKNIVESTSKMSQLVSELNRKPSMKSSDQAQKDISKTETLTEPPAWMKMLAKKKIPPQSVPAAENKSEIAKTIAPWMQEVQRRREHKLSLRSDDETLEKIGQDVRASYQSVKYSTTETKRIIDEKQSQTKSCNMETRVIRNLSFHQNNSNTKDKPILGRNEDSKKTSLQTESEKVIQDNSNTENTAIINQNGESTKTNSVITSKINSVSVVSQKESSTGEFKVESLVSKNEVIIPVAISKIATLEQNDVKVTKNVDSKLTKDSSSKTDSFKVNENSDETFVKSTTQPCIHNVVEELLNDVHKETKTTNNKDTTFNRNDANLKETKTTTVRSVDKQSSETVEEVKNGSLKKPDNKASDNPNTVFSENIKMVTFCSPVSLNVAVTPNITNNEENKDKAIDVDAANSKNAESKNQPVMLENKNNKSKPDSVQLLLKEIEDFSVKHELRSEVIVQDIRRLELVISQQRDEVIKFIQEIKRKLETINTISN